MNQEIIKIEQEQKGIEKQVHSLTIVNQETYQQGASVKITLSTFRKKLKIFFDPMVSKSKAAYDEVKDTRDKVLKPTMALEDVVKGKLKTYERKMEKEAEEAKRKAEKVKQDAIDAENKRREDKAKQDAKDEAEVMGVDEKDVKVAEVEKVNPEDIETEQPLPTIDKVAGLGIRRTWKARVTNKSKLPLEYLTPNIVLLNGLAREYKGKFNIPGAEAYED